MSGYKYAIFCAAVLLLSAITQAGPLEHPLLSDFPRSTLFDSDSKTYDKADLVAGEILYQKGEDEGYVASSQLQVVGESYTYINDYSPEYSSVHLYEEMLNRLKEHKFELLYSCTDAACGDPSGWQLYLSSRLQGEALSQRYVLAKQKGRANNEWYVQFYSVDLDKEPRTYLKILDTKSRPKLGLAINKKLLTYPANDSTVAFLTDIPTVLFSFGESTLTPEAEVYITKLADELSDVERLVLSGHTDSAGAATYNDQLAMKRATTVANALKNVESLKGLMIEVRSFGESQPVADNTSASGRGKNRRVSIAKEAGLKTSLMD